MFDLDKSIKAWLKQFSKHRAFDEGSIREMELHLRDHIEDLIASGYENEEAFDHAVSEFGEIPEMATEEFLNLRPREPFPYFSMYRNYIKVAVRGITKQPFFTFLNTFGLAIGIAGGILISLFIYDELNFDKMFSEADRIYRINIDNKTNGEYSEYATAPGPMANVLVQDCPQVESVMRFRLIGEAIVRRPDDVVNVKEPNVVGADTAFFSMFGLTLLEGDTRTSLKEANSLILTKSAKKNHFGSENALGQSLILNDDVYIVTGIMEDFPSNSFLRDNHIFVSLSSFDDEKTIAWNTWNFPTFVKINQNSKHEDLQVFLDGVKDRYLIPWAMTFVPGLTVESARASEEESGNFMRFNTTLLTDIHLYSADRRGEFSPNSDIQNVYIMSLIGFVLLLLATVNFMNLSTANSLKRAKEVGIRKTLGSSRVGLIRQFLTESALITFLSLVIGLFVAMLALPFFNLLSDKQMVIPFYNPSFWLILLITGSALGLLAGSYPAFFMSRFIPIQVLKGTKNGAGGNGIRNGLVIFQFAISVFLIVSTLVVYQQVSFIQNKDLGFQKDQVLVIDDLQTVDKQTQSLKDRISQLSQVGGVSLSSYLPTPSRRGSVTYFAEGAIEEGVFNSEQAMIIQQWEVDHDYISTLNLEVIAGRGFDRAFSNDVNAIVINETTARMMNVSPEKAIGMKLTTDFHRADKENMEYFTIIGVIKNFHFESLRNEIGGLTFILGGAPEKMIVKLINGDFINTLNDIEEQWDAVIQGQPINYYFMDQSFNQTYKAELRLGSIFMTFTILSIFIACLGLFGLATFNAQNRTKEIGIKKVMGASVKQITYQLSYSFLKLVMYSILVSVPLSWFVMNQWLQDFSYRIEIGWWIFAMAAFIALIISLLTVSYQSIKAAFMNPVASLRSE
jgi:putative ABC transport system permease protein